MRKIIGPLNIIFVSSAYVGVLVLMMQSLWGGAMPSPMTVFPLIYALFVTVFLCYRRIEKTYYRLTLELVLGIQWIRCVILPVLGELTSVYDVVVQSEYYSTVYTLMLAEEFIIFIACFLLANRRRNHAAPKLEYSFNGTYIMYGLLAVVSLGIYLSFGNDQKLFSFIFLDVAERVGDNTEDSFVLVSTLVLTAITFISLSVINKCHEIYKKNGNSFPVFIAVVVACLMLCIIVGERRSRQVYLLFAYTWILINLFPLYKGRIIRVLGITAVIVLAMMSIYKFFNAFLYNSYFEALTASDTSLAYMVRIIDSYFFGFSVLNRNLFFITNNHVPFQQMFVDLFRNVFGLHYLFVNYHTTTELYNSFLYDGKQMTGYLFSSIGYGYAFLGVFAPLMSLLNLGITALFERLLYHAKSMEWAFTYSMVFMRFGFGVFSCIPPLLNSSTRLLVLYGLVIFCSGILRKKLSGQRFGVKQLSHR